MIDDKWVEYWAWITEQKREKGGGVNVEWWKEEGDIKSFRRNRSNIYARRLYLFYIV